MTDDKAAPMPFEIEAVLALRRAEGHAVALTSALDEAGNAMRMTDSAELEKQLGNLTEWARMIRARAERLARRLAEGAP